MKNHKAMPHERPPREIKNDDNDKRMQPSSRLFKILDLSVNVLRGILLKTNFRFMNPSLIEDLSMLVPMFRLCCPHRLINEIADVRRIEMPSMSYHVDNNSALSGGKDDEDNRGENSRKIKNSEKQEKQGEEQGSKEGIMKQLYKVSGVRFLSISTSDQMEEILSISASDHAEENRNEAKYKRYLDALGLKIVEIEQDGNCMFRALADQLRSDQELHMTFRQMVVNYMMTHPQDFQGFSEGNDGGFQEYCQQMSLDGVWGDNLELHAASLLFKVNIHIYVLKDGRAEITKMENFHGSNASTIHLSYHNGSHYNSLRFKTEEEDLAQHVTAELASYPEMEKCDQKILRLVLKETIGTATVEEAVAALQLHNWNPDESIKYLLQTAVERLAKGLVKEKLSIDCPPLLSPLYQEEHDEDIVRLAKAQAAEMAKSPRIQDALKLLNGDLDGEQETGEEMEKERKKDAENMSEKLKQHFDSAGDNSVKDMFDNMMPDSTSVLPETAMGENGFNLECEAVEDDKTK